jgi:hypothetical protein
MANSLSASVSRWPGRLGRHEPARSPGATRRPSRGLARRAPVQAARVPGADRRGCVRDGPRQPGCGALARRQGRAVGAAPVLPVDHVCLQANVRHPTRGAATRGKGVAFQIERRRQQSPRTSLATDSIEAKPFEKLLVKAVGIFIGVVNGEGHIDDPSSPALASADGVAAYHRVRRIANSRLTLATSTSAG